MLLVRLLGNNRLLVVKFGGESKVICRHLTVWGLVTLNSHVIQGSTVFAFSDFNIAVTQCLIVY